MTRRHLILLGVVVVLLMGNGAAAWWRGQHGDAPVASTPHLTTLRNVEYTLARALEPHHYDAPQRDIFSSAALHRVTPVETKTSLVPAPPVPIAAPAPPPPDPAQIAAQLAEQSGQALISQIKLLGVMFRGARGQAFLADQTQRYFVVVGDVMYARFVVEQITADAIVLKDRDTALHPQIRLSGA